MKRTAFILMLYLILFSLVFAVSMYGYFINKSLIDIGLSVRITNFVVVVLSVCGILKTVWHIYFL